MKKKLLLLPAILFLLTGKNSNAQIQSGCIAPDFTLTDINGNFHHLYDILNQGKTVFIDFSTIWCQPCWDYHTTHALEDLYNTHGPAGTNEVMVFMIESDATTNTACLYGPAGCNSNTMGNWVAGTSYPIIDNAAVAGLFQVNYYPTIYMITPDRVCRENGQLTTLDHYSAMQQYVNVAISGNDGGLNWGCTMNATASGCAAGANMQVRLYNFSASAMTSASITVTVNSTVQQTVNWNGNVTTYDYAVVTISGVTGQIGSNVAQLDITSINGGADMRASNNSTTIPFTIYSGTGGPAVAESFPSAIFPPAGWMPHNGGSPSTWSFSSVGYNNAGSARLAFWDCPAFEIDALTLPAIDFTGFTSASLSFDRAYKMLLPIGYDDKLDIKISADCGDNWSTLYSLSGSSLASVPGSTIMDGNQFWIPTTNDEWVSATVPISAAYLTEPSVFIKFEAVSANGENLYLDNININLTTGVAGAEAPALFDIYPNPALEKTVVSVYTYQPDDLNISVVNSLGQEVEVIDNNRLPAGEHKFEVNTENFSSGVYFIKISTPNGTVNKKFIKQ